tara:strand:- start:2247 stop:2573 length:327 start_codon:yes stop_codon:yes gene_type:complete
MTDNTRKKSTNISPSGMYPQVTHPNAPDWVIRPVSSITVYPALLLTWLQNESWWKKHVQKTDKSGNECIVFNIKKSIENDKFGNEAYYLSLWQKENKENDDDFSEFLK